MKKITLFVSIILFNTLLFGQDVQNIRFIHIGVETKPIGTLLISIGQYIIPSDKPLDSLFGVSVETDKKTFMFIKEFLTQSKYVVKGPISGQGIVSAYKIICPDQSKLFVTSINSSQFFDDLRQSLRKEDLDLKVIDALKYYY